jgi:hypothetical protein
MQFSWATLYDDTVRYMLGEYAAYICSKETEKCFPQIIVTIHKITRFHISTTHNTATIIMTKMWPYIQPLVWFLKNCTGFLHFNDSLTVALLSTSSASLTWYRMIRRDRHQRHLWETHITTKPHIIPFISPCGGVLEYFNRSPCAS